jgi:hypothetical protein
LQQLARTCFSSLQQKFAPRFKLAPRHMYQNPTRLKVSSEPPSKTALSCRLIKI